MNDAMLHAAVAVKMRLMELRRRAASDTGLSTLEVALIAAGLIVLAVALVNVITVRVNEGVATIRDEGK